MKSYSNHSISCIIARAVLAFVLQQCILIYNTKTSAGFIFTSAKTKSQHYSWHCTRIQYFYRITPNNKILMLHARCIYCYLLCCSPATKINEAPPPKRNKRLIVKAVHDRSTWWWFIKWHITTKALSVAIIIQQNTDKTQKQRQKKIHKKT